MFRSKTLFIVGAGGSFEVGLPTGEMLKKQIAEKIDIRFEDGFKQISGDRQITECLRQHANQNNIRDVNEYLRQAWKLREALPLAISIDNLLDAHRDNQAAEICGKLGIVKCILEAERSSKLFFDSSNKEKLEFDKISGTWFAEFVKVLTEGVPVSDISKLFENVSFITFNYDRCIEHLLFHAIQVYYGISEDEAKISLKNLKIFHPYGQIGKLSWQDGSLPNVNFGDERFKLLEIASHIKTFTEQISDQSILNGIRQTFQEAEVVVFLGFAYHRQNLAILEPQERCLAKRIFATAFGISGSDAEVVQKDISELLKQDKEKAFINVRRDLKCYNLFSEYWRSLTSLS